MLSTAAFLQQMQEIFGEGLCWDSDHKKVIIYATCIGTMVGVDSVVGAAKLVLASAVSEEMKTRERECILSICGSSVCFMICHNIVPYRLEVLPPISWVFFSDDVEEQHDFDLQLWIAKKLTNLKLFDDQDRCTLARKILLRVYEENSYGNAVMGDVDAAMADYLLRQWTPRQISVTHEEIRRTMADLSCQMQTLQELESVLYSP